MPKYLQMVCQSGKLLIINSGLSERVSDIGQLSDKSDKSDTSDRSGSGRIVETLHSDEAACEGPYGVAARCSHTSGKYYLVVGQKEAHSGAVARIDARFDKEVAQEL